MEPACFGETPKCAFSPAGPAAPKPNGDEVPSKARFIVIELHHIDAAGTDSLASSQPKGLPQTKGLYDFVGPSKSKRSERSLGLRKNR